MIGYRKGLLLASLSLLVACSGGNITNPVPVDQSKPTVSVTVKPTTVTAAGSVTIDAIASDNVKVAAVEFYDGNVLISRDDTAPYQAIKSYNDTNNGNHTIRAVATDSAGNQAESSVVLPVNISSTSSQDTESPKIVLAASPVNLSVAGSIVLTATATDNVKVSAVEFYDGVTLISTDDNAPYIATKAYTTADNGAHTLKAVAVDTSGNRAESTTTVQINISVATPVDAQKPTVALSINPATLTAAGNITLTATASDNVKVAAVEFYDGAMLISTDDTAPYTAVKAYTIADNGAHALKAVAVDTSGNRAESTSTLSVAIPSASLDTQKPTVALSINPATLTAAGSVTLTATAADNVQVAGVEFYDGATLISTDDTAPYTATKAYSTADNGVHTLKAVAVDTSGNRAESTSTLSVNISSAAQNIDLSGWWQVETNNVNPGSPVFDSFWISRNPLYKITMTNYPVSGLFSSISNSPLDDNTISGDVQKGSFSITGPEEKTSCTGTYSSSSFMGDCTMITPGKSEVIKVRLTKSAYKDFSGDWTIKLPDALSASESHQVKISMTNSPEQGGFVVQGSTLPYSITGNSISYIMILGNGIKCSISPFMSPTRFMGPCENTATGRFAGFIDFYKF